MEYRHRVPPVMFVLFKWEQVVLFPSSWIYRVPNLRALCRLSLEAEISRTRQGDLLEVIRIPHHVARDSGVKDMRAVVFVMGYFSSTIPVG